MCDSDSVGRVLDSPLSIGPNRGPSTHWLAVLFSDYKCILPTKTSPPYSLILAPSPTICEKNAAALFRPFPLLDLLLQTPNYPPINR